MADCKILQFTRGNIWQISCNCNFSSPFFMKNELKSNRYTNKMDFWWSATGQVQLLYWNTTIEYLNRIVPIVLLFAVCLLTLNTRLELEMKCMKMHQARIERALFYMVFHWICPPKNSQNRQNYIEKAYYPDVTPL